MFNYYRGKGGHIFLKLSSVSLNLHWEKRGAKTAPQRSRFEKWCHSVRFSWYWYNAINATRFPLSKSKVSVHHVHGDAGTRMWTLPLSSRGLFASVSNFYVVRCSQAQQLLFHAIKAGKQTAKSSFLLHLHIHEDTVVCQGRGSLASVPFALAGDFWSLHCKKTSFCIK